MWKREMVPTAMTFRGARSAAPGLRFDYLEGTFGIGRSAAIFSERCP